MLWRFIESYQQSMSLVVSLKGRKEKGRYLERPLINSHDIN